MITDINSIYHQFYKMTEIVINNKRIAEFCKKYNNFDITQTLLSFIDFIEHNTKMPSLDSTLAMQILDNIKSLQNQVSSIDSTFSVKQKEIKNEYIDDLKTMMMMNNNEKIIPIIKEYNEAFFNKLSIMIPKEQQQQAVQLQLILKNIEQSVVIEMNKGITQNSIDQMMISIEQKFATILTHSEQKITNVLSAVSENKKDDLILHSKLDQMLTKLGKNNEKGKVSENLLYGNLQNIYPTAEIRNMSQTPHAGDFWILRKDKPTILVENKNHDGTVYTGGVQKFIDDMNTQDLCGIMISQNSNIVYRENYEIEIHNGNVAVYIHEGNYDPLKIKIAVQIIDTFKNKIEKNKLENGESFNIDKQALQKINMEFQRFNNKKIQHIAEIKTMYELLTRSAEEMEMDALGDLLEAQGMSTNVKKFICSNCPRTFPTKKGLDTHERICTNAKKVLHCEHCEFVAKTKKGLKTHCIKIHALSDDESEASEN